MASVGEVDESFPHLYDGGQSFQSTCDMHLVVEGVEVPVHSQALLMHSRFFRPLIMDMRKGDVKVCHDSFGLTLDGATKLEDLKMLLKYLYNRHATVDKVGGSGQEAGADQQEFGGWCAKKFFSASTFCVLYWRKGLVEENRQWAPAII